ncbi:hypothetical protein [Nitrosomonas communis]|nr:hypothetical protein [Nitrosomonas communis]
MKGKLRSILYLRKSLTMWILKSNAVQPVAPQGAFPPDMHGPLQHGDGR